MEAAVRLDHPAREPDPRAPEAAVAKARRRAPSLPQQQPHMTVSVALFPESDVMAGALRRAGKQVELVTLDGEDHWLSRAVTRLQMLEHVLAFLKVQNPPESP